MAKPYTEPPRVHTKSRIGVVTAKADRLYAHVFDWPKFQIEHTTSERKVAKAYLLADHNEQPLKITATPTGTTLHLPKTAPDSSASVIVIKYESI